MAGVILYCAACGEPNTCDGEVPVVCPLCRQVTTWSTAEPYHVTEMDARFLRSLHISAKKD
jgi:hypothetical protein